MDTEFQSAPPHGGRRELLTHERQRDRVSIRAPARGATTALGYYQTALHVSIRAPARGATWGSEHKQSLTARGASDRR